MARAGATLRAWDAFEASGFANADQDYRALTLKGRLLKDRASQAPADSKSALFAAAGRAYEQAAEVGTASYPLINAAAMALQAGERLKTVHLANRVLDLIESGAEKGETPYWGEATRAEALLLLGRIEDAKRSLAAAVALAPKAWEDHAATLRQFSLILAVLGQEEGWLDRFRPPPTMHYAGILGIAADDEAAEAAIAEAVKNIGPGFAYGAIAAGADIIAAEAALAVGAELHIVLPSDPQDFRQSSVDPLGGDWGDRFDALLDAADSLSICNPAEETTSAGVALAELHAMGLAIEKASQLQARAIALRIEPAGRPAIGDPWFHSGRPMRQVAVEVAPDFDVERLAAGRLVFDIVLDGSELASFDTLGDAVAAILSAAGERAAIDCRITDSFHVQALLPHSAHGMVAASRTAALALLASGFASRVETIGEMAFPDGPIEICLAALVRPPG